MFWLLAIWSQHYHSGPKARFLESVLVMEDIILNFFRLLFKMWVYNFTNLNYLCFVRETVLLNWIFTGKVLIHEEPLEVLGVNVIEELSDFLILHVAEASCVWGGTTWNAWEDFTDVVEDAIIVMEEGSDFWNLYVAVVRTFCWTLYAVYR